MSNPGRKVFKKTRLILAVLAGLVVIGLLVVYLTLNGIVRHSVESSASSSLQVKTTLSSAAVAPFSGNVALGDLRVASPDGFAAPEMLSLNQADVRVSYGELFGAPVRVASVKIDHPKLVLEQAGGKFNYLVLMDRLKSPNPPPAPGPAPAGEPLKLVIGQIDVVGAEVEIRPGIPGFDRPILLTLPDVSLKNIGNAEGNQNGAEVGRVIMDLVRALAEKAAESDKVPPEVRQLLKLNAEDLKNQLENRARQEIEKATDKVNSQLGKVLDKLLKK